MVFDLAAALDRFALSQELSTNSSFQRSGGTGHRTASPRAQNEEFAMTSPPWRLSEAMARINSSISEGGSTGSRISTVLKSAHGSRHAGMAAFLLDHNPGDSAETTIEKLAEFDAERRADSRRANAAMWDAVIADMQAAMSPRPGWN